MQIFFCGRQTHNFGDYLNSWFWEQCMPGVLDDDPRDVVYGIGTILCSGKPPPPQTQCIHVLGSGYGYGRQAPDPRLRVWFVRGPRTAAKLNLAPSLAISDPALLLPHLVSSPKPPVAYPRSFIPHIASMMRCDWTTPCSIAGIHLIDPRTPLQEFIASVRASGIIIAESLHGAIVADSFGVPWIPVVSSNDILPFKWQDWLDTLHLDYRPRRIPRRIPWGMRRIRDGLRYLAGRRTFSRPEARIEAAACFRPQPDAETCAEGLLDASRRPGMLSNESVRNLLAEQLQERIHSFARLARNHAAGTTPARDAVAAPDPPCSRPSGQDGPPGSRGGTDLNVLCVKWGTKYSVDYVHRLHNMVRRHLTIPHRFVCLTDDPAGLESGVEPLLLPRTDLEYCWNKLLLFERRLGDLEGTALFFDLDVIITGSIDDLVRHEAMDPFVGVFDWNRPKNPQFNASVMRYRLGAFSHVIEEFDSRIACGTLVKQREWDAYLQSEDKVVYREGFTRYGGDQEWTSAQVYSQRELRKHCFPKKWILSFKKHGRNRLPDGCKVMVFHGDPKPHEVDLPYVAEHWR